VIHQISLEVGDKVKLNPDITKRMRCIQDRTFKLVIPTDVKEWTVKSLGETMVSLTAPGYGERPYGSGCITMNKIDLIMAMED